MEILQPLTLNWLAKMPTLTIKMFISMRNGSYKRQNAGTNIYNGNVSVNGNNVTFNTRRGTLKFAGEENQEFGGGTNTLTFNKLINTKQVEVLPSTNLLPSIVYYNSPAVLFIPTQLSH
ncbi:MAG: hypothetical protein IPK10_18520 [Bacteroidetes bacterium]|nr:hypothetical protein [Bacteroidota bacterium]